MNDFYVYAWLRPCGTPFYIGKGRGRRAGMMKRGITFRNIVAKIRRSGGTPEVVKLHDGLTEDEAFQFERLEIARHGRRTDGGTLVNLTDGGEGVCGLSHSEEARAKMSESHTGLIFSDEHCAKISVSKRMKPPISGNFKGVSFSKINAKWKASIYTDGKLRGVGYFDTEEDAARAYDAAAIAAWGTGNCYTNLPAMLSSPPPIGISKSDSARKRKPARGFKGVCFDKSRGKWAAQIRADGRNRLIGRFADEEAAARAYDRAAVESWGIGNCYLNFPQVIRASFEGGALK